MRSIKMTATYFRASSSSIRNSAKVAILYCNGMKLSKTGLLRILLPTNTSYRTTQPSLRSGRPVLGPDPGGMGVACSGNLPFFLRTRFECET